MADDEYSMVCSLADRDSDFESSKLNITANSNLKKKVPTIMVTTSDEEDDEPSHTKKR